MKLHIGCGSVYLAGWKNIDVYGPKTFLASERPDLVQHFATTEDNYYARHADKTQESLRAGPLDQEYVCDAYGDFSNIPGQYWETDEVLARHSFEHLSITEAHTALDQIDGIMKPNGILRLDVPDHEATLKLFKETGDDFYIRHLLGPRRNDRGFHMMSYTRDRLRALVEEHGFVYESEEPNIHFYPAFCLRFRKPGVRAPRDYVKLPDIPKLWMVADIGPGKYPLHRADVYFDADDSNLEPLRLQAKLTRNLDINSGFRPIEDKQFDYVWCSHVFEHLSDPIAAAKTLSRIGKRGTLVLPSALKEELFNHEEGDHLWSVLPDPQCGAPIFVRKNAARISRLASSEIQSILCRLFRTGPNRSSEQRYLRQWFSKNEAELDVVVHWEGELKVRVIG